jgi:hypothetical protein
VENTVDKLRRASEQIVQKVTAQFEVLSAMINEVNGQNFVVGDGRGRKVLVRLAFFDNNRLQALYDMGLLSAFQ